MRDLTCGLASRAQHGERDALAVSVQVACSSESAVWRALGLAALLALCSALLVKFLKDGIIAAGRFKLGGGLGPIHNAIDLAAEKRASGLLVPIDARKRLNALSDDVAARSTVLHWTDARDALLKALQDWEEQGPGCLADGSAPGAAGLALSRSCQELTSRTAACAVEITRNPPDVVMRARFFWEVADMGINLAAAYENLGDAAKATSTTSGACELALVSLQPTDAAASTTLHDTTRPVVQAWPPRPFWPPSPEYRGWGCSLPPFPAPRPETGCSQRAGHRTEAASVPHYSGLMAAPQSPAALRHRTAPQHTDLQTLPFEQACAEIAARHHLSEPHAFQLAPGGAVHLVRLSDGAALCGRGPQLYAEAPQVTGPLTCRRCVQAVARRLKGSLGRRAQRVTPTRKSWWPGR